MIAARRTPHEVWTGPTAKGYPSGDRPRPHSVVGPKDTRLAIPAGVLSFGLSASGLLGFVWMAVAGAWAVAIYLRSQRPAWITIGAGARIGLVTGLLGAWAAAATMSVMMFAARFFLHQGKGMDDFWQGQFIEKVGEQWAATGIDAQTIAIRWLKRYIT